MASFLLRLTLVFGMIGSLSAAAANITACFQRTGNTEIVYSEPYRNIWRVETDTLCMSLCAAETPDCKSVVYDSAYFICYLHRFSGDSGPGFLVPAYKKAYYKLVDPQCLVDTNPVVPAAVARFIRLPDLTTTAAPQVTGAIASDPSIRVIAACPTDQQPIYVVYSDKTVNSSATDPVIPNVRDPEKCISACTRNKVPSNIGPVECNSFVYDSINNQCRFTSQSSTLNGNGPLITSKGLRTFVRQCVAANDKNAHCAETLQPAVQGVKFSPPAKKTLLNVNSLADCMSKCMAEHTFLCKAVVYQAKEAQCSLYDIDSDVRGVLTPVNAADGETYYAENTCHPKKSSVTRRPLSGTSKRPTTKRVTSRTTTVTKRPLFGTKRPRPTKAPRTKRPRPTRKPFQLFKPKNP